MYSSDKLIEVFKELGQLPLEEIREGILKSLDKYICDDDVTMMILKRNE